MSKNNIILCFVISLNNEGVITSIKTGDDGYWKVAACVFIFGLLLLAVLLIRWIRGRF